MQRNKQNRTGIKCNNRNETLKLTYKKRKKKTGNNIFGHLKQQPVLWWHGKKVFGHSKTATRSIMTCDTVNTVCHNEPEAALWEWLAKYRWPSQKQIKSHKPSRCCRITQQKSYHPGLQKYATSKLQQTSKRKQKKGLGWTSQCSKCLGD